MARVFSLNRFSTDLGLPEWRDLFRPDWVIMDFYKLEVRYLGNVVSFIQDENVVPEYFEVILDTRVQATRLRVADCIHELVVSADALKWWYDNTRIVREPCTEGFSALDYFAWAVSAQEREWKLKRHIRACCCVPVITQPRLRGTGFIGLFEKAADLVEIAYGDIKKKAMK